MSKIIKIACIGAVFVLLLFFTTACTTTNVSVTEPNTKTHDGYPAFTLNEVPDTGNMFFVVDEKTGCEFVVIGGSIVPRSDREGVQKGCR